MKSVIVLLGSFMATTVFAHGNKIDAVRDSSVEVLKMFKETETEALKAAFVGVKVWSKGAKIFAKVYYVSGETESSLNYECKMDHGDGQDKMTCQKQ